MRIYQHLLGEQADPQLNGRVAVRRRTAARWLGGLAVLAALGCAQASNLVDPAGPRFAADYAPLPDSAEEVGPVRVVSFNIRFAQEISRATAILRRPPLAGADVIALQELDERGVDRIARSLRLDYVYYPATIHPTTGKLFGPAILSRWPIERSWKVLLPHPSRTRGQRRTATAAVLRIRGVPVLAYAVHLETPVQVTPREREDQARTILRDAASFPGPVVIAGDFNGEEIGLTMRRAGYQWLTEGVGPTVSFFNWDHIFVRRLSAMRPGPAVGVVRRIDGASDHHPVWALLAWRPAPAPVSPPTVPGAVSVRMDQ
jgi:endonuclease/exonuclease/phosphatase family metal-dependent hydrolase